MSVRNEPGILKLRKAMLLNILGFAILFFGILISYGYSSQIKAHVSSASPVIPLLVLSAGAVIVLLAGSYVYGGFKIMHSVDPSIGKTYETGKYGALVQCAAAVFLSIGVYIIIFSARGSLQLGSEFTAAGYILGFLGALPVALAFYRLGEKYKVAIVRFGGIAYFLIPILGPLLLYVGLGEIVGE